MDIVRLVERDVYIQTSPIAMLTFQNPRRCSPFPIEATNKKTGSATWTIEAISRAPVLD